MAVRNEERRENLIICGDSHVHNSDSINSIL